MPLPQAYDHGKNILDDSNSDIMDSVLAVPKNERLVLSESMSPAV